MLFFGWTDEPIFIGDEWAKPASANGHACSTPHRLNRHPCLRVPTRIGYRMATPVNAPELAPALVDHTDRTTTMRGRERRPLRSRPGIR